ncbi:hypothetical protein HBI25_194940 [Parastagonospora nodorum]|nr:hypothetical protein HBH49_240370 [Parastagonospora nodorum]KAH4218596.1 hypothetical protein HBI06_197870 [Parastagonospora nodorum]KAH4225198.1 hypothetical protein HBI05_230660 [Parastagonospora nodorum]KAH4250879.1 hypothetical protein HBI03_234100 [Parastagonospora nodorum]KAH4255261.1 hypothetical protein HBI04_233980 [Parastagonospora nodorum]
MQRSLAAASIGCAQLLAGLTLLHGDVQYSQRSALQATDLEDQSARFQIWAGNLGAFQRLPASASLDYRLRGSPKIAMQILELLQDLEGTCEHVRAIALGERANRRSDPETEDMDADEGSQFEETDNESDLTDDDSDEQEQNLSEAEELFESIKDTLASLFRLAVVIRNSSPRDRYARALGGKNPFDEQFDVAHVGEKFPKLNVDSNVWLKDRIGKAIAQRRQYLCYAREHRYKLGKEPVELWKPAVEVPKAFLQAQSQAARTSNSRPLTTVADTTASTLFLQETPQIEMDFRDDQSQTSFAFSKGGEESQDKIQLPRLSEVAKGQASFECPFCWTMQAIRKESAWRKHALADLRPYVCTFGNCDVKLFADRKTWFEHELQTHRATWRCHFCNHDDFPVKEALQNHMHHKHSQIGEDQLGALLDAGRRPNTFFKASDCPFCDNWDMYLRAKEHPPLPPQEPVAITLIEFRRHVGSHMQDLALFAIPRGYLEGDGDADSAASARAAGAGKESASVARSRIALSVDSYDTDHNLEPTQSPVDLKACIEAINTSLSMPSPAFEEQLIAVLPGLSVPQFIGVKMSRDLSRRIKNLSDFRFRIIVEAACCGPTGANARWLRKWESSAPGSLTWLSIVIRILTKRYNFDTSEDFTDLNQRHRQYLGSLIGCPSWVINALEYVFAHGIAVTPGPIPEDRIMRDIDVLRASFAAIGRSNENREASLRLYLTASNRHLRKIFRVYGRLHPDDDLITQIFHLLNSATNPTLKDNSELYRNFVDALVKEVANSALNSVTKDARRLYTALQTSSSDGTNPETAMEGLAFEVLYLHWNKPHLRSVKSEFEDLYGVTVESYIDNVCSYWESSELLAAFLKALIVVDTEDPMMEPGSALELNLEQPFASSTPYPSILDPTHGSNNPGSALPLPSDLPAVIPQVSGVLGFQEAAWTLIVIKRWWRLYKQTKILEKLLTSISQDNPLLDGPAWLPVLSRYPIFTECPDFLDAVRPHIQLQGYDANQLILGKRDCSTSIGWLITGTTWYIATYNQNNQRREWVTEETGVTIGLVDTLFGLPSLIEHRTKTPCLLATLPNVTFNELAKSSPGVVEHITAKDFGASFDLTQECLRIEVEFGHPWWHIFHTLPSTEVNRAEVVARILQSTPDPQVILLLQRTIDNIQHTPLDLAADIDDIETAKVLLEYGAPVLLQTVRIVLRNSNLEFMELILNRRGAAEAANRLLRNGNKEDVAKFQNLLKELQGSVPVNLAVERDYNVALVEPRDISEGEIEAPDEDTNEPDDLILEDDIPFSRDDFAAAIENCFKNDDATTESTSHVGQLLEAFPDKATASAFLNSIALYNDGGFSPVTGAIKHDRLELLAILLKNGIDTNAADANGLYPLDLAMSSTERRTEKCVLLLDHGATKSSQDRRAELAQLKEQIRIAKDHGSEWSEILQRAATSEESLALVQNILEKAEHPRLTANILLPSGQTALDVAIAQNNADLVLLLLQHEAWPAENSALVAAEANSDLDPRIVGAMRKHLPVAFKNSTAAQAIKSEAPDENANGNEGTDTEAEQTTAGEHNDNSQKAPIDTDEKAQIDANEIEDEPMTADTEKLDYESTAAHADTTQETCQSSSGPGLAEQATQVAVHEKAQTEEQVKIG